MARLSLLLLAAAYTGYLVAKLEGKKNQGAKAGEKGEREGRQA
jgi:hypothetical protein